jgi:hypothetical protein
VKEWAAGGPEVMEKAAEADQAVDKIENSKNN